MDNPKFAAILKKFEQAQVATTEGLKRKRRSDGDKDASQSEESADENDSGLSQPAQGLVPLPQPAKRAEKKIKTTLEWLVEPISVDPSSTEKFEKLGVSPELCEVLRSEYPEAFAVQTAVIPAVLTAQRSPSPHPMADILVNSYTGSGKTLAYCIPIVDVLKERVIPRTRALILVPTRPLMAQVIKTLETLIKPLGLHVMSLRAERSFSKESEILRAQSPDIVVATPGRLVDHLNQQPSLLQDLRFLVIDEADRLLGQYFQDWISSLAKACPPSTRPCGLEPWNRSTQRLIFSATLTRDPGKLASLQIRTVPTKPKIFTVGLPSSEFNLPTTLEEVLMRIKTAGDKPLALASELNKIGVPKTIVFARSNEAAARLARLLSLIFLKVFDEDINCAPCSGEMPIADRKRVLRQFEDDEIQVLVCTDLIARGIDMRVELVVNYDLPLGAREYVHRVGRTARAGAEGTSWTLTVSSTERKHFWTFHNEIASDHRVAVRAIEVEPTDKYDEALSHLENEVMGRQ